MPRASSRCIEMPAGKASWCEFGSGRSLAASRPGTRHGTVACILRSRRRSFARLLCRLLRRFILVRLGWNSLRASFRGGGSVHRDLVKAGLSAANVGKASSSSTAFARRLTTADRCTSPWMKPQKQSPPPGRSSLTFGDWDRSVGYGFLSEFSSITRGCVDKPEHGCRHSHTFAHPREQAQPHSFGGGQGTGGRRRHPHRAGAARAQRRLDDDDLHARAQPAGARGAQPGRWLKQLACQQNASVIRRCAL